MTTHILVLCKNYESLKEHVSDYVLGGGTYNLKTRSLTIRDYIYYYHLAQTTDSFIQNATGRVFSGMLCLDGEYSSEVINFAMSRIRRP